MAEPTMLDRLKLILGISPEEEEQIQHTLDFALQRVEDAVKNYCNITEIPKGLETLVLQMAAEVYHSETSGLLAEGAVVKSIAKGDTKTEFHIPSRGNTVISLVNDYKTELQAYRKVRW